MLNDCLVLVTRPEQVADGTIRLFAGWGAEICHAPVLEVHPLENKFDEDVGALETLIFVSRHAVRHSTKLINSIAGKLQAMDILAVGPATADLLKTEYGCKVSAPAQGVGGMALLASFDPDYWHHRKVGVIRGVDAPTVLLDELTGLNADVRILNVYQRKLNPAAYEAVEKFVTAPYLTKVVTGFSSDSLSALRKVAVDKFSQLATMPLLVVSAAVAQRAIDLSWSGPIEIADSTDEVELRAAINRLVC